MANRNVEEPASIPQEEAVRTSPEARSRGSWSSMPRRFWMWVACGPLVWLWAHYATLTFDPVRIWLLMGCVGHLVTSRYNLPRAASTRWLWIRWMALHGVVLLILLRADEWIFNRIELHGIFFMPQPIARVFFALGDGFTEAALLLLLYFAGWRASAGDGLRAVFNACANDQILKTVFGRAFPSCGVPIPGEFRGPLGLPWHDAFPSGHTSSAVAVLAALAYHYPRQRWLLLGLGALIGLATVVTRTHWMGDAYAGYLVGLLSAYQAIKRKPNLLGITA